MAENVNESRKTKGGFAYLAVHDRERLREICSQGGRVAHELGVAHRFVEGSEEARAAGKLGGAGKHKTKRKKLEKRKHVEQ